MRSGQSKAKYRLLPALALLCLLLFVGCAQKQGKPPEPTLPPPVSAAPECRHEWADGRCVLCGVTCLHDWVDGICDVCGYECPHEEHDEDAICLQCGKQHWHSFRGGVCSCGREALFFDRLLPEDYWTPAGHAGTVVDDSYTDADGKEHPLSVYLPYGYDENERYNLVICIPGDNCHAVDWTESVVSIHGCEIQLSVMYDHMLEEHLCAPFILVGVDRPRRGERPELVAERLRSSLLPYLAEHYATWIDGSDEEAIIAAREHIALCGASRGAGYLLESGMRRCPDLIGNFCCMSHGYITLSDLAKIDSELLERYGVNCFVSVLGCDDPYSWDGDRRCFAYLVKMADCLTENENAFSFSIYEGHNWATWSAGLFSALQYMF